MGLEFYIFRMGKSSQENGKMVGGIEETVRKKKIPKDKGFGISRKNYALKRVLRSIET
jgi:hypothetical protein